MKNLNKKGFTLIELLAVIVILGVIMVIAVPAVTKYITNSKKDSYVSTAKMFIDAVRTSTAIGEYQLPVAADEVTVVSIKDVKLNKGGSTSPFGEAWQYDYSYVAISNVGTEADPSYAYYFQGIDAKGNYIEVTEQDDLTRASVSRDAGLASTSIGSYAGALKVFHIAGTGIGLSGIAGITKTGTGTAVVMFGTIPGATATFNNYYTA